MRDQAENLRRLVVSEKSQPDTKVISIVSGKGGVGKSNFSVNFAIGLSQAGKKVVVFDLDIGMANVDILLGLNTKYNIVDMIENDLSIWEIIEIGPENVHFISGGSGFTEIFQLNEVKFNRFVQQLELLHSSFDFIIFDMGAGVSENSLQFILSSNESIVVTTPEPTSITDAYAMLKYLHKLNSDLECRILVNRAESKKEGILTGQNLQRVAKQFLKKDISIIGYLPYDQLVLKAVKRQIPFLLLEPKGEISKNLQKVVSNYLGEQTSFERPLFSSFIKNFIRFFNGR